MTRNYCCKTCGNLINRHTAKTGSGKCKKCAHNSRNYCCIDCGNLIERHSALYGQGRCDSCNKKFHIGKNASTYIDGRSSNAKCMKCGKKVSYGYKLCKSCCPKGILNIQYKNINMRSSWEIQFAYFLDCSNIKWKYEPKAFELTIDSKKRFYIPDFYLPEFDCWIEIKGWFKPQAKKKMKIFKKKYSVNIKIFDGKILNQIGVICRKIK
jgi:hypothetical protein